MAAPQHGTHNTNELDFREAVQRYFASQPWREVIPQPGRRSSYRNAKNNGWILGNVNGYLAFVPDRGGVLR